MSRTVPDAFASWRDSDPTQGSIPDDGQTDHHTATWINDQHQLLRTDRRLASETPQPRPHTAHSPPSHDASLPDQKQHQHDHARATSLTALLAQPAGQPSVVRRSKDRAHSPARSRSSGVRLSYSEHLQQQQQQQQQQHFLASPAGPTHHPFPHTPSTSSQQLYGDPSPSISRIGADETANLGDEDDGSVGLLLGPSKRRRGRNDSHSSFGSSVLPAGYNAPPYRAMGDGSYPSRQLHASRPPVPPLHTTRNGTNGSRPGTGAGLNGAAKPSAAEVESWLRSSYDHDVHSGMPLASPPLPDGGGRFASSAFHTFAPAGRITKKPSGMALSEAGSARGGGAHGSASGLSAGVMSAGPGERRRRRKESAARRDGSGFASLQESLGAALGGPDSAMDPNNRRIDSIEEWRAKSSGVDTPDASEPTTTSALLGGRAPRHRRKSSSRKDPTAALATVEALRTNGQAVPTLPTSPLLSASRTLDSIVHLAGHGGSTPSGAIPPSLQQRTRSASKVPSAAASATNRSVAGSRSQPTVPALPDVFALSGQKSQQDTPARRFVRWMSKEGMRSLTVPVILLTVLLVKWSVGRGAWSGKDAAPLFGDFEAQRHWVELTLHLPTSQWYFYDLPYWGLDYPPLTAWVSLACGYVARTLPSVGRGFELSSSRGDQDDATVTFMRASVLVLDFAVYVPAVVFFLSRRLEGRGSRTYAISLLSVLLQPSLILIDNGHFQYNGVMLGLAAACFALLYTTLPNPSAAASSSSSQGPKARGESQGRVTDLSRRLSYEYVLAAFFFCLSLCFKQMALYYAPAVFAVMLGRCVGLVQVDPERGVSLFCGLGLCVLATFGVVCGPWLTSLEQLGQLLHRIFPLARGLFEDKVANVWCFLSVLPVPQRWKLRNLLGVPALARLSLLTTLLMILPGCVMLFAAAAETAKREMMVEDRKMLQAAVARSKARRQSVSSVATLDERATSSSPLPAPASGAGVGEMRRTPSHAPSRSRKSGGGAVRTTSISGSLAPSRTGGLAPSDLQSLLAGEASSSSHRRAASVLVASDAVPTPPVASTLPSPAATMLPYGLTSISTAFFLFGFQTHEKSILLPLLPLTLLLGAKGDRYGGGSTASDWHWAVLANNVGAFSMFPLLQRDGLALPYAVLVSLWNWIVGTVRFSLRARTDEPGDAGGVGALVSALVHGAILLLHAVEVLAPRLAPALQAHVWRRYPDVYPVVNVWMCTPVLGAVYVWATVRMWQVGVGCALEAGVWNRWRRSQGGKAKRA